MLHKANKKCGQHYCENGSG